MSLPKVLIIGQPFNNDTGGGITLTNLFSGWEKDKLAVACSGYLLLDNIDTSICDTYYQLGFKEHRWVFPFSLIQRKYTSGLINFSEKKIQNLTIVKSKTRVKLIMGYLVPFLKNLGLMNSISRNTVSEEFKNFLNRYQPDIIYAQPSSRQDVLFYSQLKSYLKKPMIVHMMDDWPSIVSEKGLFKNYWKRKIDKEFRILLTKTDLLMSISDYMSEEYKLRYGKESVAFHNPININFWKKFQRTNYELGTSPSILYAGRIGLGIDSSLKLIAEAVDSINNELGIDMRFIMQAQDEPEWVKNYKCISYQAFVPYSNLPEVFSAADLLILPYDFSEESIKYIKYSMPTKAPEYMVSGTPIIVFAPAVTAIVKYSSKYNWAAQVTEKSTHALATIIKQLILSQDFRMQLAKNAMELAEKNHDDRIVTRNFRNAISLLSDSNK